MKFFFIYTALLMVSFLGGKINGNCQNIGINTTGALPNASAMLDVSSASKGLLIPRVSLTSTTDVVTITSPATSLLVYNTNAAMTGGAVGYWYWDGVKWVQFGTGGGGSIDWTLLGNAGTVDGTNFLGTTDNKPLNFKVNNQKAGRIDPAGPVFLGYMAGNSNTGTFNTGLGYRALYSNTTGEENIAIGYEVLRDNTTGSFNTAMGSLAMRDNTTGTQNTGIGHWALQRNSTGDYNTAIGASAMESNTTGAYNTAIGHNALIMNQLGYNNTAVGSGDFLAGTAFWNTGDNNTAIGLLSLYANTTGNNNTAVGCLAGAGTASTLLSSSFSYSNNSLFGFKAGFSVTTGGNNNTAAGYEALRSNTTGYSNVAVGVHALYSNTIRPNLVAIGDSALYTNGVGASGPFEAAGNTAVGSKALYANTKGFFNTATSVHALFSNTTGSYNTANGFFALRDNTTGSNNTALGYGAGADGTTHSQCTFIGAGSTLTTNRTNVTLLGYGIVNAQATGNNQVCVGNTSIAAGGLRAAVTGWTAYSDARFKTNVQENVAGLNFILKLKPVTYHVVPGELHKIWGTADSLISKMNFSEAERETRIGFLAQDVEKAAKESGFNFPGIDVPGNDHEVYTLRYVDFIMPMVKGMQEQQQEITNYKLQVASLRSAVQQLEALNTQLQISNGKQEVRLKKLEALLDTRTVLGAEGVNINPY